MLHVLSKKITAFLFDDNDKYPSDVYAYGIEITISTIIGAVVLLTVGLIFNFLIESIIYMVSLSVIRMFSGGYHAKSYLRCNMVLIISYAASLLFYNFYIRKLVYWNFVNIIILIIFSVCIFMLFAPVKNENKDNSSADKIRFKIISIILMIAELMVSLIVYELTGIFQVLIVLPAIAVIDISILVEIIIQKRREHNESKKEYPKKSS